MIQILVGDATNILASLPDDSINCVVTSPPYWGLRKYDGEQEQVWGGDAECEHEWGTERRRVQSGGTAKSTLGELSGGHAISPEARVRSIETSKYEGSQGCFCRKCGAWRGAYGLEPTPEMYVEHTVLFLREIRRVLRDDGVVFLNLGDSYAGSQQQGGDGSKNTLTKGGKPHAAYAGMLHDYKRELGGLKPKDMCLIPFRVALAAQADGWWVRSDIIWAKPNPMPESVKDRPTSSYEHIFLFTKSKDYYWDADAVREPQDAKTLERYRYGFNKVGKGISDTLESYTKGNGADGGMIEPNQFGRNIRDVWTIATQPSGFKHYAAFPEEIPTRCIKAATRPGDLVLDPFCGTGRTLYAAQKLGRNAIGIDLSERYCDMARQRCGLL